MYSASLRIVQFRSSGNNNVNGTNIGSSRRLVNEERAPSSIEFC
jgi:hypothetical protein